MEMCSEEWNKAMLKRVEALKSNTVNNLWEKFEDPELRDDIMTALSFSFDEVRSSYLKHNGQVNFPHWFSEDLTSRVKQNTQYRDLTLLELESRAKNNSSETALIGAVLRQASEFFSPVYFGREEYKPRKESSRLDSLTKEEFSSLFRYGF